MNAADGNSFTSLPSNDELPINAEKIEARLSAIWQDTIHTASDDKPLTKLCLANLVIVCDAESQAAAASLADELARRQPARLLTLAIDESIDAYAATVRTACAFNKETESVVCWEVIELRSRLADADQLPGAVRSLLVDSVPVLLVDLRKYQSTPAIDRQLLRMATFAFVRAELIPIAGSPAPILPIDWFDTLGMRELFGTIMAVRRRRSESTELVSCTINATAHTSPIVQLLFGWIGARLLQQGSTAACRIAEHVQATNELAILSFADTSTVYVEGDWLSRESDAKLFARWPAVQLHRPQRPIPLSQYLFLAATNPVELADYASAWRFLSKTT